jgi:outer membrane protein assembly factor BamD (BamD/ComL family)
MAQVHNPYIVGSPVSGESGFFGREDIFDFVRATLSAPGQNVAVLYGQRRIGKTSILHQLPRHLPPEFASVYFDLQGQERRPLPHVLYDLARRIARTLDRPIPTRDAFRQNGRFFQTDFLSQAFEALGPRRLVLLFDEFDVLGDDPLLPEDAFQSLFPYLQQLIQDRPQLDFVLVVGRRIDELPGRFGQIFKTAQFKPVSRLSSPDARRLVKEPAHGLLHYEDAAVDRILALTANHPYFTQLLCSVIFEQAERLGSEMVTVGCVDDAIEDALERGEGGFGWIWDGLPGAERVVLSAIASIADELSSVNDKQLRQVLEENNVRLLGLELTSAPQGLLEWDILAKVEGGGFRFVVDLVRRWVRHQHPLASTTRDLGYISQRAARLYENARDAHLAGEYETAIGDYRQALVVNPNHPWAPLGLAQALFEAGRLDEAVQAFEDAFQQGDEVARDGLVEAAYALANNYVKEKKWDEAFRLFNRALALRPDQDDIRGAKLEGIYQLALSYYKTKDWSNAVKWLTEVREKTPKYKDANLLLENAQEQLKLSTLYERGQQALAAQDWETARNRFQEVLDINPNYKDTSDLYNKAHREVELPKLYTQAQKQLESQDWDGAIKILSDICDWEPHYGDVQLLLEQAWRKKRIEEDYQRATERCAKAEVTKREEDWQEAAALLQKVADKDPGYKTVSAKLTHAQRQLEYFELVRKAKEQYARGQWQAAVRYLEQAVKFNSWDPELADKLAEAREKLRQQELARHQKMLELYERGSECYQRRKWGEAVAYLEEAIAIEPDYSGLSSKLSEARKKLRQQLAIRIALGILNVVVFTIVIAVFQNQIAMIGSEIGRWWFEIKWGIRATPTLTVAVPGVDRIEVWMDGDQLNLDQLPSLTAGEAVIFEVIVFDTNGNRYTSDNLVCKWSVAPLGDEDLGIKTDLCKTFYVPSQKYSSQTVRFEVEGLKGQFEPGHPISMEFNIIK